MPAAASSCRPMTPRNTLLRMARAVARHKPARVIALGDSFHDPRGRRPAGAGRARPAGGAGRGGALHLDRRQSRSPSAGLAGRRGDATAWRVGGLIFRHEPLADVRAGRGGGASASLRQCRQMGPQRAAALFCQPMACALILPSFGAYTGGLDVGDAAIASLFAGPFHAYMLGQNGSMPSRGGSRSEGGAKKKGGPEATPFRQANTVGSEPDPDAAFVIAAAFVIVAIMALVIPLLVEIPVVIVIDIAGAGIADSWRSRVPAIAIAVADHAGRGWRRWSRPGRRWR